MSCSGELAEERNLRNTQTGDDEKKDDELKWPSSKVRSSAITAQSNIAKRGGEKPIPVGSSQKNPGQRAEKRLTLGGACGA